jgi:hypothetical protein
MKRTKKPRNHGPGSKSVYISTSIPKHIDAELRRLAAQSELTRGGMARECIEDAVTRGLVVSKTRRSSTIVEYPLLHPENPTVRAADDAGP